MKSIAIVGGGAGGMCAAIAASKVARDLGESTDIQLFERNPRMGIKILISGGGKCNITHAGPIEQVLTEGFLQINERRFLKSSMYRFTNEDVLALLARHGVAYHSRDNGRIFPDSSRAEDVLRAFEEELRTYRVQIRTRSRVEEISRETDAWSFTVNGRKESADAIILATGGTSYRKVGTTGDGISYAGMLGHTIVPVRAALAPIYLWKPPVQDLVGLAVRDAILLVIQEKKIVAQRAGDVLLTHKGISGPATLDISREASVAFEEGSISIKLNLLGVTDELLRDRVQQAQNTRQQQQVKTWIEEMLPNRLAPFVLDQAAIPQDRKWSALTREERQRLLVTLLRYDLGDVREIPTDRGEVTAGGVSLKEVDPKTMMSRLHAGLFFAGEMLDIAGEIGGYNLQASYSTGWVAGEEAVNYVHASSKVTL